MVRNILPHNRARSARLALREAAPTWSPRSSRPTAKCDGAGARASARRKAGFFATLTDGRKPPCGGSGSATLFHPLRSCTFESTLSGGKEAEAKFTAEMTCQSNSSNCTYREARYCRPTTHSACLPPCSWSSTDCTVFSSRHASQDINRGIHRGIDWYRVYSRRSPPTWDHRQRPYSKHPRSNFPLPHILQTAGCKRSRPCTTTRLTEPSLSRTS